MLRVGAKIRVGRETGNTGMSCFLSLLHYVQRIEKRVLQHFGQFYLAVHIKRQCPVVD